MILIIIALFIILAALAVALVSAIIGGVGFIAVFGDVLVFALVVYLIVKAFKKMNSKKERLRNEPQFFFYLVDSIIQN